MQREDFDGARKLLAEAMAEFPADAGFDNLLGIIEAQQKRYARAEAAFKRAIARSPKFTGAYLNLGRLYLENSANDLSAPGKALQVYQRVRLHAPENAEANYQTAVLLGLRGEHKASLDRLSRLPPGDRQGAQALAVFCANYAGLGDRARADECAAALLDHADFSEADAVQILPVLDRARRGDLAIRLIEGAARRAALTAGTLHRLGLLYEEQGRLAEARAAMERAAQADRPLVALLSDLARVAGKQRDATGALGFLAHARDLAPNDARIHYFFGAVCVEMNLGAEAHLAFGKAVQLEPDNPQYNFAMGYVSSHRHDPEEAVPYLQKYLRLKPGDARAKLLLGMAYFRSKNFPAAGAALRQAVRRSELSSPAHFYLGSIARQEGRIDEAIAELELALQPNADYPDGLAELGQCRLQRREYAAAEKLLRRAVELDPNHYTGNFNLLTLYARTNDPRADELSKRFEEIKKRRDERAQDFLRAIEVRPYEERK